MPYFTIVCLAYILCTQTIHSWVYSKSHLQNISNLLILHVIQSTFCLISDYGVNPPALPTHSAHITPRDRPLRQESQGWVGHYGGPWQSLNTNERCLTLASSVPQWVIRGNKTCMCVFWDAPGKRVGCERPTTCPVKANMRSVLFLLLTTIQYNFNKNSNQFPFPSIML